MTPRHSPEDDWAMTRGNTIGSAANQFVLSDIAVPEPANVISAILNILLSSFVRRRRRGRQCAETAESQVFR
jgi:hypothetical protein